jgi:hypothetical protein
MSTEQKIMWEILTEYSAALSGGSLELAGGMSKPSQTEAQPAAPDRVLFWNRPVLGLLWNKVSRP